MCLCIVWNHSPSPLTILFARSFCWIFVSIYVSLLHFLCSRSFHSFILFESFQLYVLTVPCSSCCSAQDRWLCAFTSVECGFVLFIRYRVFVILVVFFFFFCVVFHSFRLAYFPIAICRPAPIPLSAYERERKISTKQTKRNTGKKSASRALRCSICKS